VRVSRTRVLQDSVTEISLRCTCARRAHSPRVDYFFSSLLHRRVDESTRATRTHARESHRIRDEKFAQSIPRRALR